MRGHIVVCKLLHLTFIMLYYLQVQLLENYETVNMQNTITYNNTIIIHTEACHLSRHYINIVLTR